MFQRIYPLPVVQSDGTYVQSGTEHPSWKRLPDGALAQYLI